MPTFFDLSALKAALDAATQGEWEWWNGSSWWRLGVNDRSRSRVIEPYTAPDGHPDLLVSAEDRAFIAAAHNALPGLIAEVERLREAASLLLEQKRAGETTVIAWQMLAEALAGDRHD